GDNEADFINFVVGKKAAETLANYMKKGSQNGIEGRNQTRSYEANDGNMVYVTEAEADRIQNIDAKDGQQQRQQTNIQRNQQQAKCQQHSNGMQGQGAPIDDEDLSF